jgi:phage antirepressor YoqD-like protein
MFTNITENVQNPKMYNCLHLRDFLSLMKKINGEIELGTFLKAQGYIDEKSYPTEKCLKMDMFRVVETNVTTAGMKSTYCNNIYITKKGMSSIFRRILNQRMKTEKYIF